MKALKYFSVLTLPIVVYISFTNYGWLTYLPIIFIFCFVPFIEFLIKPNKDNFSKEEEKKLSLFFKDDRLQYHKGDYHIKSLPKK